MLILTPGTLGDALDGQQARWPVGGGTLGGSLGGRSSLSFPVCFYENVHFGQCVQEELLKDRWRRGVAFRRGSLAAAQMEVGAERSPER